MLHIFDAAASAAVVFVVLWLVLLAMTSDRGMERYWCGGTTVLRWMVAGYFGMRVAALLFAGRGEFGESEADFAAAGAAAGLAVGVAAAWPALRTRRLIGIPSTDSNGTADV